MITNEKLYEKFIANAEVLHALDVVDVTKVAGLRCDDGCPGWAVFNADTDPSIQRCDTCARFPDDASALCHVLERVFLIVPDCTTGNCSVCRLRLAGMDPTEICDEEKVRRAVRADANSASMEELEVAAEIYDGLHRQRVVRTIVDVSGKKHGIRVVTGADDEGVPYVSIAGGGEDPRLSIHLNDLTVYDTRDPRCARCGRTLEPNTDPVFGRMHVVSCGNCCGGERAGVGDTEQDAIDDWNERMTP
jgi:hypothetical protein